MQAILAMEMFRIELITLLQAETNKIKLCNQYKINLLPGPTLLLTWRLKK